MQHSEFKQSDLLWEDCHVFKPQISGEPTESGNFAMAYVLSGEATRILTLSDREEERLTVRSGDYFFLEPESICEYTAETNDFARIVFRFHPRFLHPALENARLLETVAESPQIGIRFGELNLRPVNVPLRDDNKQVLSIFERAYRAYTKKSAGSIQLLHCFAIEILITSLQKLLIEQPKLPSDSTVASICDYINEHFAEPITLTQICRERYFSIPYISKKFKKTCGVSFEQYLKQTRIHHACTLLLKTNYTIDAVAAHVSYSDTVSFRNAFRAITGKSPSEFRKQYGKT